MHPAHVGPGNERHVPLWPAVNIVVAEKRCRQVGGQSLVHKKVASLGWYGWSLAAHEMQSTLSS
jgi:hypothetical protein